MNHPTSTIPLLFILLIASPLPKKGWEKTTAEERPAKLRCPKPRGIGFEDAKFRDRFFATMMRRHGGRLVLI